MSSRPNAIETPEFFGDSYNRVPAPDVLWMQANPEWELYFWIARHPGAPDSGPRPWQKGHPPHLKFHKGRSWTRTIYSSRSLEMDHGIGVDGALEEVAALGERLAAEDLSSKRQFWDEMVALKDDPRTVRVDGQHYRDGGRPPGPYNGFGGSRFRVKFHDGRRLETFDMWHEGAIPPALFDQLPDNAVFAGNGEVWP